MSPKEQLQQLWADRIADYQASRMIMVACS